MSRTAGSFGAPSLPGQTTDFSWLPRKYGSSLIRWRHPTKFGWMSADSGTRALPRSTNGNLQKLSANLTIPTILRNWTDLQTKVLKVSESCLRHTSGTSKSFLTKETLNTIEESRRARIEKRTGQYRELKREAVRAVRRDKEAQVRGVCETVESHLRSTVSRPAYRKIRMLHSSSSPPRCYIVKADGRFGDPGPMGLPFRGVVSCGPNDREFPGDLDAVRDADPH